MTEPEIMSYWLRLSGNLLALEAASAPEEASTDNVGSDGVDAPQRP